MRPCRPTVEHLHEEIADLPYSTVAPARTRYVEGCCAHGLYRVPWCARKTACTHDRKVVEIISHIRDGVQPYASVLDHVLEGRQLVIAPLDQCDASELGSSPGDRFASARRYPRDLNASVCKLFQPLAVPNMEKLELVGRAQHDTPIRQHSVHVHGEKPHGRETRAGMRREWRAHTMPDRSKSFSIMREPLPVASRTPAGLPEPLPQADRRE